MLDFGVRLYGGSELSKHFSKCMPKKMKKFEPDPNCFLWRTWQWDHKCGFLLMTVLLQLSSSYKRHCNSLSQAILVAFFINEFLKLSFDYVLAHQSTCGMFLARWQTYLPNPCPTCSLCKNKTIKKYLLLINMVLNPTPPPNTNELDPTDPDLLNHWLLAYRKHLQSASSIKHLCF